MSHHNHRVTCLLIATCALAACKPAATPASATDATAPSSQAQAAAPSTLEKIAGDLEPLASPKDAVKASMDKFLAVHSYHASMAFSGGPGGATAHHDIDFVAPDRYRMVMPMGTQFVIGDTMYMHVQGRTMQVPMPKGTLRQWRDPARLAESEKGMTVQAQGSDTLDGTATRKYLVHHEKPEPVDVTMWINGDDLPVQIQVNSLAKGKAVTSTIRYSRYDDPTIKVDPPQ